MGSGTANLFGLGIISIPPPNAPFLLDEVRLYGTNLAASDIKQLPNTYYDADGDGCSNLDEYQTGRNPLIADPLPPSNLSASSAYVGLINLAWTDNASVETGFKIERSTNGSTYAQITTVISNVTTYADRSLSPGVTYYYRVKAYNAQSDSDASNVASALNPALPAMGSGLLAYWRFAEGSGTNSFDSSGNAQTGNLYNGVVWTNVNGRTAVKFDGSNDKIEVNNTLGNFGTNAFTISYWVRTTSNRTERILSKRAVCDYASFWAVGRSGASAFFEVDQSNSSNFKSIGTTGFFDDDAWHHVVSVRSNVNIKIYVDGLLRNSADGSVTASISNSALLTFGVSVCNFNYSGLLDEAAMWNRALSASEVQQLYWQGGDPTVERADLSGTITYSGEQKGPIHVLASVSGSGWSTNLSTVIAAPGPYTLRALAIPTNYHLKAFLDVNADAQKNGWDSSGTNAFNPHLLANNLGGIDATLIETIPATLYVGNTTAQSGSSNPTVTNATPRFSAIHHHPDGTAAIGYRIQVSTNADFSSLLWDTTGSTNAVRVWSRIHGGVDGDTGAGVATDGLGHVYFSGQTWVGGKRNDFVLHKLDAAGTLLWTRTWGSTNDEEWAKCAVGPDGYVYLAGYSKGAIDGQTITGGRDFSLTKLNSDGSRIWTRLWGSTNNDSTYGIAVDALTNIYVVGGARETVLGQSFAGESDLMLAKFNADGSNLWTRLWGSSGWEDAMGVTVDGSHNVYVAGYTDGEFGGQTNSGPFDLTLTKFNADGSNLWTRIWGSVEDDWAFGVVSDGSTNLYVAGVASGEIDSQSLVGDYDFVLSKFTADGTRVWSRMWGSTDEEEGDGQLAISSDGRITIPGTTWGSFGGYTNAGEDDLTATQYSADGVRQWSMIWGSTNRDYAYAASVDQGENVYIVGGVRASVDGQSAIGDLDRIISRIHVGGKLASFGGNVSDNARTPDITYAGSSLTAGLTNHWRIKLYDTATNVSPWSASGNWFIYNPVDDDTDDDGLVDTWETLHFGNLSQNGSGDPDGDGLSNETEETGVSDPNDYYNGILPNLHIVSGNNQSNTINTFLPQALTVLVTNSVAGILTNAPVDFARLGTNGWLSVSTNSPSLVSNVVVRTGTSGQASVFYKNPSFVSTNSIIGRIITANQTNTVTFTAIAIPAVDNGSLPVVTFLTPSTEGDAIGFQDIIGHATTTNPAATIVSWSLTAVRTDGTDSFTVSTGATEVVSASLGRFDSSLRRNGPYVLTLEAEDSFSRSRSTNLTVIVEGQAKPGEFSFSQQDVVIPVSGIPLTVVRTYSSLLQNRTADFGYGWAYSIADVDLEIDEQRTITEDLDSNFFSMRTGGDRNMTLTLPDGRRTTFYFTLSSCGVGLLCASWEAAPGVQDTLVTTQDNRLNVLIPGQPYWEESGPATHETNFDFSEFKLTTKDGTEYLIQREDLDGHDLLDSESTFVHAYGAAKLTKITDRSGNRVEFASGGITNFNASGTPTKTVTITRDGSNRITALRDPNSSVDTVKYLYSASGNLTNVLKLVNATGPVYETTTYLYENGSFPHYITTIKDPRGITPLRSMYDGDGRLIGVVDAFNKTNSISRNLTTRTETVTDRLGNQTIHVYDERGNVISSTDSAGTTSRSYDADDNLLSETNALGFATSYSYDGSGNRLSVTDPLGKITRFTYDGNGNVLTITNALGKATVMEYDGDGNLTKSTDANGKVTGYTYDGNGNRTFETNALNQVTRYQYDGNGFLTNTTDAAGHSTAFTYDANGNQLTSTTTRSTPGGSDTLVTTFVYDAQNRVIKTIDPLSGTNSVAYNGIGKQDTTTDALGRVTSYTYDNMGQLTLTTYPDSTTEGASYDAEGRRTNSVDRAGRATSYTYDALGRLTQTTFPDATSTLTSYDAIGRVLNSTDARGLVTGYGYDAAGRRTSVTNALGQVSTYSYDDNGNQKTFVDALSRTITYNYDALDRRTNVVYPDSTTMVTVYDDIGQRRAEVDQAGISTAFGYDSLGRLVAVTNALSGVTRYFYDEVGNLTNQVDALNHATSFEYDKLGRRTKRTLPAGQSETYGYDSVGNQKSHTDFNGLVVTNSYDSMNRLLSRWNGASQVLGFGYTATGLRSNMVDASGTTLFSYNSRDWLTSKATPFGSLSYGYDANGNVTNIASSNSGGAAMGYRLDSLNRISNALNSVVGTTVYGYDAVGNLSSCVTGNGVTNTWQYNSLNRLTNLTARTVSGVIASYAYSLGAAGNRTNVVESSGRAVAYRYDQLYRLTNEVISADAVGPNGSINYQYDAVGNRLSRTSSVQSVSSVDHSYNSNDWLSTDSYDSNGNTTNSAGNADKYDYANRLTNRNSAVSYLYDGDGNRVRKTEGTTNTFFLVDSLNPTGYAQVLEELQSVSGGATNVVRTYVYGLDLIAQHSASSTNYFGYDGHGNVRYLTGNAGSVTDTYTYDAFGVALTNTGATANSYLYSGEQMDSSLGMYYLRARYMNPGTGRFWTMDSWEGQSQDPFSLHRYLYAESNPANLVDPTGYFSLGELTTVQGIQQVLARLKLGTALVIYDRATTFQDVAIAVGRVVTTGSLDAGTLASLWSNFIPFQKVFSKIPKVIGGAQGLVGGISGELTKFYRKARGLGELPDKKLSEIVGEIGSSAAARAHRLRSTNFPVKYHGIDGVYEKNGRLVIVEAKGGVNPQIDPPQMSRTWINDKIGKLQAMPEGSLERQWGDRLMAARDTGTLDAMVVRTKITGDVVQPPIFEMKNFGEIGPGAW